MTRWIIPFIVLFHVSGASADEVTLAPIVVEGGSAESSPVDLMNRDFILPSLTGQARATSATGSLADSIQEKVPHAIARATTPGGISSFRGLGRSADETSVQVFGIGLNMPQGGGFDLSVFPQYLWSKYLFQAGPSHSGSDPRASAGTLSLVPWSASAISKKARGVVTHALYSDADLTQLAAGAWSEGSAGLIAGYSLGRARGPSAALSARWGQEASALTFHLLGTRLDVDAPGSKVKPTPDATQLTARIIPVLQFDRTISPSTFLKTSVFYDAASLRYENPTIAFKTDDRIRQTGVEVALLWKEWRFGAVTRQVSYESLFSEFPTEFTGSLSVTRDIEIERWLLEPSVQIVGVSRAGMRPGASFGVRRDFVWLSAFARASYAWKFPTLVDRFYESPGFRGNPDLKRESNLTLTVGVERVTDSWSASLQGYSQQRWDSQVSTGTSFANSGTGSVLAAIQTFTVIPSEWLDVTHATTLKQTRLEATGKEFPYQPAWIQALSLALHPRREAPPWELRFIGRAASSATGFTREVEGYGVFDAEARVRLFKRADLSLRVENLLGEGYEVIQDYPAEGRVVALGIRSEL